MKKILLAINGMTPGHKVFDYAVQLCQRLKAELCVLQIVEPGRHGVSFKRIVEKARKAGHFLEESMTAVTFAEAGEHETARDMMIQARKNLNELLPETAKAGIVCSVTMKAGAPGKEIIRYVHQHRDVMLTVYDDGGITQKNGKRPSVKQNVIEEIKKQLPTPMVMMHG